MDRSDQSKGTAASDVSGKTRKHETGDATEAAGNNEKAPVRWAKWTLAVAGAIVTIGGAVAVISQTTHWLSNLGSSTSVPVSQLEVSPNLGISFHQDGQLDPMSADNQGTVTVTLKSEPFELWFPTLASNESLEVCAATGDWVFANAAETGKGNSPTCLTPGTGVAAGPYGSGYLVLTTPDNPASTNISEDRALPAAQGYGKYYVSNFASGHGQIYLVFYRYSVNEQVIPGNPPFDPQKTEDFILNIG